MPTTVLSKPSADILVDLINAANATTFVAADFNFSNPIVADVGAARNTDVVVTGTGTSTFVGPWTVHYNRLDFATLFNGIVVDIPDIGTFNTHADLLTELNVQFGLGLQVADIVDQNIVFYTAPATQVTYPLDVVITANPNSLAYLGSFTLQLTDAALGGGLGGLGDLISYNVTVGTFAPALIDSVDTTMLHNASLDGEFAYLTDGQGGLLKMAARAVNSAGTLIVPTTDSYTANSVGWDYEVAVTYDFGVTPDRLSSLYNLNIIITSTYDADSLILTAADDATNYTWSGIGTPAVAEFTSVDGATTITKFDMAAIAASVEWTTAFPNTPVNVSGYPNGGLTFVLRATRISNPIEVHELTIIAQEPA